MQANYENTREAECVTLLRSVLVILLVFCAFSLLVFGVVAANSKGMQRRSVRSGMLPSVLINPHESSVSETNRFGALSDLEVGGTLGAEALVNQDAGSSTSYIIRVRIGGRDGQLIPVTAPPGGLLLEVRDMTGDNVRNDFVLRPALIHWPLIVLINDGHDHFTVAISASLPTSLNPSRQASRSREIPVTAALSSASSKMGPHAGSRQILALALQRGFPSPLPQRAANEDGHRSVLGRAPPFLEARA